MTEGESERERPIPLPDVDDHEYTRLLDCLNHCIEDAVTSDEQIRIKNLRNRFIEEYERHDR
jgi:hypothetical protein